MVAFQLSFPRKQISYSTALSALCSHRGKKSQPGTSCPMDGLGVLGPDRATPTSVLGITGLGCRVPSTRIRQEAGRSSGASLVFQLCRYMGPADPTGHFPSPFPEPQTQADMHRNLPGHEKKKAGAREPDAGFFCTSVFLTPQPVAAYNKTEIRKSNQNTHPKAKKPLA